MGILHRDYIQESSLLRSRRRDYQTAFPGPCSASTRGEPPLGIDRGALRSANPRNRSQWRRRRIARRRHTNLRRSAQYSAYEILMKSNIDISVIQTGIPDLKLRLACLRLLPPLT